MTEIVNSAYAHIKSEGECIAIAREWALILIDIIPEHRLMGAYKLAFRNHNNSFPINHYEIKMAWDEIKENERKVRVSKIESDRRKNPIKYCEIKNEHLIVAGEDDGNVLIVDLNNPTMDVVAPCPKCRFLAYKQWRKKRVSTQVIDLNLAAKMTAGILQRESHPLTSRILEAVELRTERIVKSSLQADEKEINRLTPQRIRLNRIERYLKGRLKRRSSCTKLV